MKNISGFRKPGGEFAQYMHFPVVMNDCVDMMRSKDLIHSSIFCFTSGLLRAVRILLSQISLP
jgi:hypothetical protein